MVYVPGEDGEKFRRGTAEGVEEREAGQHPRDDRGRPLPASEPTPYNIPTGSNPAFAAGCVAYYGDAGRYYGD